MSALHKDMTDRFALTDTVSLELVTHLHQNVQLANTFCATLQMVHWVQFKDWSLDERSKGTYLDFLSAVFLQVYYKLLIQLIITLVSWGILGSRVNGTVLEANPGVIIRGPCGAFAIGPRVYFPIGKPW